MYFRDNKGLKINRLYIDGNGSEFSVRWLSGATDDQLVELGVTKHPDPIKPYYDAETQRVKLGDDGEYQVVDLTPQELENKKPKQCDMAQARLALLHYGKLDAIAPAIEGLPSPKKEQAQIEWEYKTTVSRDSVLVNELAPAIGLTDSDLDDLFALAVTL